MITVGFVGAGKMAYALARAFVARGLVGSVRISDPDPERRKLFETEIAETNVCASNAAVADSDVLFLAIKPQTFESVAAEIGESDTLVVSIMAGITLEGLESRLPNARVVRVMPNTPCLVGEMAAGFAGGHSATGADLMLVRKLLSAAGVAIELPEAQLDAVTGLSGSGPAFMARIFQAFIDAGVACGLDSETATKLTLQTARGTAQLLTEMQLSPEKLVEMVSSPNGTTVAGREILESSDVAEVVRNTVMRATDRSRELGE